MNRFALPEDSWHTPLIDEVRQIQELDHSGLAEVAHQKLLTIESEFGEVLNTADVERLGQLRHFSLWIMAVRGALCSKSGRMTAAEVVFERALAKAWEFESQCRGDEESCFAEQIIQFSFEREGVLGWTGRQVEAVLSLADLWWQLSATHPDITQAWAYVFEDRMDGWGEDLGYTDVARRLGLALDTTTPVVGQLEEPAQWTDPIAFRGSVYDQFDDQFRDLQWQLKGARDGTDLQRIAVVDQLLLLIDKWLEYSPNSVAVRTYRVENLLLKAQLELNVGAFSEFARTWSIVEGEIEPLIKAFPEVKDLSRDLADRLRKVGHYARYRKYSDKDDFLPNASIGGAQLKLVYRIARADVSSKTFTQADALLWANLATSLGFESDLEKSSFWSQKMWPGLWPSVRSLMLHRVLASDPHNDKAQLLNVQFGEVRRRPNPWAWVFVKRIKWNIQGLI
jgi:hypothetical protein